MRNKEIPLDDVLNEFISENDQPTENNLNSWIDRYPQYQKELADFAAIWAEQFILPPAPELTKEEEMVLINRAMSHVLNIAFSQDSQQQKNVEDNDSIDNLASEIKNTGMSLPEFAQECYLDLALVSKISNRQILPHEIPPQLVTRIAQLLEKPAEMVKHYLARSPQAIAGKSFLAKNKPESTTQQSFMDAVRASSLSDTQKTYWLDSSKSQGEN